MAERIAAEKVPPSKVNHPADLWVDSKTNLSQLQNFWLRR